MGAVFVHKRFKDVAASADDGKTIKQILFIDVNKFALYVFNWLAYNQEINGLFAISFFKKLPKYYILQ